MVKTFDFFQAIPPGGSAALPLHATAAAATSRRRGVVAAAASACRRSGRGRGQKSISPFIGRNLATFNLALLIFAELKVAIVFALELKLSKTLKGLVYLHRTYNGGKPNPITKTQHTRVPSKFLTLFEVIKLS